MDDNEFKLDFDFEKEYGFDPDEFLDDANADDFDFSEFLQEIPAEEPVQQEPAADGSPAPEQPSIKEEPVDEPIPVETAAIETEQEDLGYDEDDLTVPEETQEEKPIPHKKKKKGFSVPNVKGKVKLPKVDLSAVSSLLPGKKEKPQKSSEEEAVNEKLPESGAKKNVFARLVDIYMEPITKAREEEDVPDPLDPRYIRRKKKEKERIFKEVYLPAIIVCIALFLIISFIVGSVSNALIIRENKQALAQQEAQAQATAADRAEVAFKSMIAEVETLAVGYDYDAAIAMLDNFTVTNSTHRQTIDAKRAELVKEQAALVEWKDYATIPNLSFHVLMADASRACDKSVSGDLAGSYNRNFVSVEEFSRILNQLYAANYVLVDFGSFVSAQTGSDSNASYFSNPMKLPSGKKPIMITETMVNYFEYMVDPDKDGNADSTGHGFANKLVVAANGDIKASYVDASGQESIGNYDLVPVLEAFIQEHPDFSYKGARAILAVTGSEGVFGYRTNTSYVASRGQSYYDEQVSQAKVLVEALRNKGYTIACYTYSNQAYKNMTTLQIQTEMTNWTNQITPVLGTVDTIVFARGSDIEAYSGTTFNVLYNTGLRYFLNSGTSPRVDINTTFVKQTRLMVTGEAMTWYSSQFSDYFDCNVVLDIASRGSAPTKS